LCRGLTVVSEKMRLKMMIMQLLKIEDKNELIKVKKLRTELKTVKLILKNITVFILKND